MWKISLFFILIIGLNSCSSTLTEKEKQAYTLKGKEIAQATFKELSTSLMTQMKAGGPAQAIPFCNIQATPIVDELSQKYNVVIKRTSTKLRSCNNEPSEREIDIIIKYDETLANGEKLQPIVELDTQKKKHFYAPIIMQENCLVCHGKLNEIMTVKTDSIIKSLYQFDIATGYSEGDLRGIWSIAFND